MIADGWNEDAEAMKSVVALTSVEEVFLDNYDSHVGWVVKKLKELQAGYDRMLRQIRTTQRSVKTVNKEAASYMLGHRD